MDEIKNSEVVNEKLMSNATHKEAASEQTAAKITACAKQLDCNCGKCAKRRAKREREERIQRTCEAIKMANSGYLISIGTYAGEKIPSASEAVRRIVNAYQSSPPQNPWRWE